MCTNTSRIRRSSSTKVRRQALHRATEPTESQAFSGRHRQASHAAWRGKQPRVAAGLSAQATTRLGVALTPPAPARPLPRSVFHFLGLLPRLLLQPFLHQEPPVPLLTTTRPRCSSATATAPPSPQQLQMSPIARCSSLVSRSNAHAFAGVRHRVPSSWPRRAWARP